MHWMDRVQVWTLKRRFCFLDGWGDLSVVDSIAADLCDPVPVDALELSWSPPTHVLGADLRIGTFASPMEGLPDKVAAGRVWWLHPADQEVRGAVVAFASWGDEGPTLRGRILGPLVREGVSILILENPYYGVRRPDGQRAQGLRTVEDFIRMQGAAFREGRALMRWAQRAIDAPVCIFGFSMGGHIGGAISSSLRSPVPTVLVAPPLCPSEPMSEGPISLCVDWDRLGGQCPEVVSRWREVMDRFDLRALPAPRQPDLVRLIGCGADGLVPSAHTQGLSDAWSLPVDWHPIGHVGIALTKGKALRRAVREVLGIPKRGRRPILSGAIATR